MSASLKTNIPESTESARWAEELELVALHKGERDPGTFFSLRNLANAGEVARQLADQLTIESRLDTRAQGAYLMNTLAWDFTGLISWLDLHRFCMGDLWQERLGVQDQWASGVEDDEVYHFIRYHWWLPDLRPTAESVEPDRLGRFMVESMEPIIEEIRRQTRLGKAALWRLFTDALAASYLNTGKRLGLADQAMARAKELVDATGKPLANDQWHFKEYCADAAESPTGRRLSEWFRVRGGCCRYYTLPNSEYCSTCVHLDEPERRARFERHLRLSAIAEENN